MTWESMYVCVYVCMCCCYPRDVCKCLENKSPSIQIRSNIATKINTFLDIDGRIEYQGTVLFGSEQLVSMEPLEWAQDHTTPHHI